MIHPDLIYIVTYSGGTFYGLSTDLVSLLEDLIDIDQDRDITATIDETEVSVWNYEGRMVKSMSAREVYDALTKLIPEDCAFG